ncbi:uncharacterized protein LOC116204337 [Punica granatum]|uniref:Uncharacterized protein LOC116204337 n=1 Tax=Punica granatum TaxID=22663 RepID=A0A6P8D6S7_PUNGR|nr:uncharacterized protein LOC116204337 [Punica granatum]
MKGQPKSQHKPWHELPNKVVLVSGASSGLGHEFCLHLAKAGCQIVAATRCTDRLKSLCDKIDGPVSSSSSSSSKLGNKASNPQALAVELDVTAHGPTIEKSVKRAWDAFGHIDALVYYLTIVNKEKIFNSSGNLFIAATFINTVIILISFASVPMVLPLSLSAKLLDMPFLVAMEALNACKLVPKHAFDVAAILGPVALTSPPTLYY